MAIFQLKSIDKTFAQHTVLQQVSLDVKKGEIVGLLGESGSGKSTLLRIAAGLLNADGGAVYLNRQPIATASQRLIPGHADIKMVHQEYNLSLVLTARENIAYALRFYEKSYQNSRIEELLQLCQLESVANQTVKTLSGGEKQRTAIAQALAEHAKVLLLDEPFAHLDLPNRHRLSHTVRRLVTQMGVACIFVTHAPTEALSLSNRLGILQSGQLLQLDTPQRVYAQPRNAYVAELTGDANLLKAAFCERHLGEHTFVTLADGHALIRPENLILNENGTGAAAQVESCLFRGMHYEVRFKIGRQLLMAYANRPFVNKQTIFVA
jgi:ABC-type Fe3+/spermidine/putrescine transport system ATPase subunit